MVAPKKRHPKVRLEIQIDKPLLDWLRKEARSDDVSIAEIVRRCVRGGMTDHTRRRP